MASERPLFAPELSAGFRPDIEIISDSAAIETIPDGQCNASVMRCVWGVG